MLHVKKAPVKQDHRKLSTKQPTITTITVHNTVIGNNNKTVSSINDNHQKSLQTGEDVEPNVDDYVVVDKDPAAELGIPAPQHQQPPNAEGLGHEASLLTTPQNSFQTTRHRGVDHEEISMPIWKTEEQLEDLETDGPGRYFRLDHVESNPSEWL